MPFLYRQDCFNKYLSLMKKSRSYSIFIVVLLLLVRLFIQIALYHDGFISLTADEFGRTIVAARWSVHPAFSGGGSWLPFYSYVIGSALHFVWELLWVPRLLTILTGVVSMIVMYLIASSLFESRLAGLLSAFLLCVNPVFNWLAGTPLTEMPNAMLIFVAVWTFCLFLKSRKLGYIFITACFLALANGLRYESWLFSVIYSLTLLGEFAAGVVKRKFQVGKTVNLLIAAFIPWVVPFGWLIINYHETHNPFYFAQAVRTYNQQWYAHNISYYKYIETFFKIDPYLTVLGIIGILVCLLRNKKSQAIKWYVAATTLPLVVDILLQGGKSEPPGNYIRYLALFAFLFYPAIGYLLVVIMQAIRTRMIKFGLFLFLGIVAFTQLRETFRFNNDPSAAGLAVGLAIRELRAQNPEITGLPVIIELSYWQYLAIKVGANDLYRVVYDRELDLATRKSQSLLLTDDQLFQSCLKSYNVSYIIVKDGQLRDVIERKLGLHFTKEVNGYAFYPISANSLANAPADWATRTCPLVYSFDQ
jgi:hypothetical protein